MLFVSTKKSLAAKLLTIVFAYYLVVTVLVTASHMAAEFLFEKDNIAEDLSVFQGTFEPGLAIALWNQEELGLQASLEAMVQVPQIVGAKVLDEEAKVVATIGKIIDEKGRYVSVGKDNVVTVLNDNKKASGLFWDESTIQYTEGETYDVGVLTLYSSEKIVFSRVQYGYVFIVINALIKTAALWAIVLWQSKPLISAPLAKLKHAIESQNIETIKGSNLDLKHSGNEELKQLEDAFNTMAANMSSAIQELEEANSELDDFVYRTSHDLRSPIVASIGLLAIAAQSIKSNNQHQAIKTLEQTQNSLKKMESRVQHTILLAEIKKRKRKI